jgi:hypothetical protein
MDTESSRVSQGISGDGKSPPRSSTTCEIKINKRQVSNKPYSSFGVVFIHGYGKSSDTWNISEYGKVIGIENSIRVVMDTITITVDDYTSSPALITSSIIHKMENSQNKWIIVCHSLGVIHGFELLKHSRNIAGICLIDPTPLDEIYINVCRDRGWNDIADYCSNNKVSIHPSIRVSIHFDYNENIPENLARQVKYYKPLIGPNDKSKIIIHPGKGHMIHYTDAPKIIASIMSIVNR